MNDIQTKIKAWMGIVLAMGDAIRDLRQVPSGVLYARVMKHVSHEQYQKAIDQLKGAGLVREEQSHLLVWVGDTCEKGRVQ